VQTAVLAEKPSVARDIARVLGAGTQGQGFLHGNGYIVTWAIGHLVELARPTRSGRSGVNGGATCCPCSQRMALWLREDQGPFEVVRRIITSPRWGGWCAPPTPAARAS